MPNNLKLIRERKNLSQAELARRVGITRQALSLIESNQQEPSLTNGLRISKALDASIQQIFFLEEDVMKTTERKSLTKIERLMLINQYRILQELHKDDPRQVKRFAYQEEIFERGYAWLYHELFDNLWDEQPIETAKECVDILQLHRLMLFSFGDSPSPEEVDRVKFQGFDGNYEAEYLAFARFFCQEGERFEELKIINSHHHTLPRYRRMLAEWTRIGRDEIPLSRPQVNSILDAGDRRPKTNSESH